MEGADEVSTDSAEAAGCEWCVANSATIREAMNLGFTSCDYTVPNEEAAAIEEHELRTDGNSFRRYGLTFELYWTRQYIINMRDAGLL